MQRTLLATVAAATLSMAAVAHAQDATTTTTTTAEPAATTTAAPPAATAPTATTTTTTDATAADTAAQPSSATTTTTTTAAPGAAASFATGAQVWDPAGGLVGTVEKTYEQGGQSIVAVNVDGKTMGLPSRALANQDGKIITSVTKAQILAAAAGMAPK
ncbi:hypothetical protein [Caulobacter sp. NIBR2454]|uniref:hypothetical protein n=1 Tax=Caulobacter sp. NIBR2454 TaxID=3015996 RepID=UPI0022B6849D|nr:hypothetical protein [Caulobacter sp. NIBR2454]